MSRTMKHFMCARINRKYSNYDRVHSNWMTTAIENASIGRWMASNNVCSELDFGILIIKISLIDCNFNLGESMAGRGHFWLRRLTWIDLWIEITGFEIVLICGIARIDSNEFWAMPFMRIPSEHEFTIFEKSWFMDPPTSALFQWIISCEIRGWNCSNMREVRPVMAHNRSETFALRW